MPLAEPDNTDSTEQFLAIFKELQAESNGSAQSLRDLRESAITRFSDLKFPTQTDEAWRYTNLAPLMRQRFRLAGRGADPKPSAAQLAPFSFSGWVGVELVFVDGRFEPSLSAGTCLPPGLQAGSLAAALQEQGESLCEQLAPHPDDRQHAFSALNTALLEDGAFVRVADGAVVEKPIHLLFLSTGGEPATVACPRSLIVAGANSRASLIESYVGLDPTERQPYFTNMVSEYRAGDGAIIDHYKLQRESAAAFHVGLQRFQLGRDCKFSTNTISLGGALVRNEASVLLDGEGGHCDLNGLYLVAGQQHVDNHTLLEHAKAHCTSHELYKGILDGRARGVFRGRIHVHEHAQKTDAIQSNSNMLLSETADVNTKPQLEIYTDDVKCTHGATVGQIDRDAIFYLRSRGFGELAARHALIQAFAGEVLDLVKLEPLRSALQQLATEKLEASFRAQESK